MICARSRLTFSMSGGSQPPPVNKRKLSETAGFRPLHAVRRKCSSQPSVPAPLITVCLRRITIERHETAICDDVAPIDIDVRHMAIRKTDYVLRSEERRVGQE